MKYLYTGLFSLSIILINPWGMSRGEIWTQPKVLALLLIVLLNLAILWSERETLTLSKSWKINKLLWEVFLGVGLLSTILSPLPLRSLFGQDEMGDGWLYWLLVALFSLSNNLLLKYHPELVRSQFTGLLIGGIIVAMSIFPQVVDWRIDYTATMGQLLSHNILVSTIFQGHQPIGLYSHRGHAAFVLVAVALLVLVAWQWRWMKTGNSIVILVLIIPALLLTQTRAAILALLVGAAYLLGRKYDKILITGALVCLLVVGITTTTRKIDNLSAIKQITSDRIYLWELAWKGIKQRPLFGWGFDGFGMAYPDLIDSDRTLKVTHLDNFSFDYLNKEGQLRTKPLISNKAHNLILDTSLSVGAVGMLCYGLLLGSSLWRVTQCPDRVILVVAIAYFFFTLTWLECAQFTHIIWWTFSIGNGDNCKRDRRFV